MKIENILFDFDGVIMDSMPVRDKGFKLIFKNYPAELVQALISYNNLNGGLSRYVKIRYFFEELLCEPISEEAVMILAAQFSDAMRTELLNPTLLIKDTVAFIEANYTRFNMHVVSGSDQNELQFICSELGLKKYFKSVHGSPTPKDTLIAELMNNYKYDNLETVLIGDSINDYAAAENNSIVFFGYNNAALNNCRYIHSFQDIHF
ncbi:HAD family hydrolase [Pontibacter harenae]|uniref:HAD family hydrolase n=1 Tax=Pontibacter harenae TaxID=2894083 RepID=UPI001E4CA2C1|nr:HAD hydrolase-like protein [Pontibacter harenae]MCC9168236.1 HAD hydrolase-like protein [Pontibacter harenae]